VLYFRREREENLNTPEEILAEINRSRERAHHWYQWRNEPSGKKKLGHWRRRLKKAIDAARAAKLEIPADPYAPPPPPPTEDELAAEALAALIRRRRFDWQVTLRFTGWAPWGVSGWCAVVVTRAHHKWCHVNRVNPRTEKMTSVGKVLRARIVHRDPELKGKDKPHVPPTAVFEELSAPPVAPLETPPDAIERTTRKRRENPVERVIDPAKLLDLLDDQSTESDW